MLHLVDPFTSNGLLPSGNGTNSHVSFTSSAAISWTLPSYIGKTESGTEILSFPLSIHLTPEAKDTLNLQAILAAPVTATLPLMDFLKVKPEMWAQVSKMLQNKGYACMGNLNPEKSQGNHNRHIGAKSFIQQVEQLWEAHG